MVAIEKPKHHPVVGKDRLTRIVEIKQAIVPLSLISPVALSDDKCCIGLAANVNCYVVALILISYCLGTYATSLLIWTVTTPVIFYLTREHYYNCRVTSLSGEIAILKTIAITFDWPIVI